MSLVSPFFWNTVYMNMVIIDGKVKVTLLDNVIEFEAV